MAAPDSTIRLGQVGLEESIDKAIKKVNASGRLKLNINSNSFTQPLGRITAATDEFTKSIEASNARVIAFGASVGVINAVSNAFKSLVKETVALEQRLTEVNVVLGANNDQLKSFGKELFNIARNTSQSFDAVSQAALEFSRQGLSVEETLKRTNDALILSRLTGLKAADSVKGLTATMNSFAQAGLNTAQVINKLAAVDVQFAVSSEDLINALSRTGSVAQDAGLSFDELVAAVTAAQQTTARGGAVIGNSFKTIFTRIQRSDTLDRLQELGIAVRNVQGETLPAMMILQQLAKSYDGLTDATKSAVAEQVGGVFQINILKAALKDLNSENSIYSRAVLTSASATDQAITKNQQLNKTLDSLSKQTITSVQELSAAIGEITVGPGIEKVLNAINDLSQGASKLLDGEGIGSTLANGVLKGLGTVISGPGLILIGGLMLKLFVDTTKFAASSFKNLLGLNKKSQEQKALQDSILATLQSNRQISAVLAQLEGNKAAQSKFLLDQVQKTTTEYTKQVNLAKQLAASLGQAGVVGGAGGLSMRTGRRAAHGFIPNFSAEGREMMDIKKGVGGVSPSAKPVRLKNFNMGGGRIGDMVANSQEYYVKNFNGRGGDAVFNPDMVQKYGMPYGAKKINAANGYIPNFASKGAEFRIPSNSKQYELLRGQDLAGAASYFDSVASALAAGGTPGNIKKINTNLNNAKKFLWGTKAFNDAVSPATQAAIKKAADNAKAKKQKSAVQFNINGAGYGALTTETTPTGIRQFKNLTQSAVFKKSLGLDRDVSFNLSDLTVGSIENKSDPDISKLIDEKYLQAVGSIADTLMKDHKLSPTKGGNDKVELSKVLDNAAGPQIKGRMFESILDYMALRLIKDDENIESKKSNQTFDYQSGIPSQLYKIFNNGEALKDLKLDAKSTMIAPGSRGPGSMAKKILQDKFGDPKAKVKQEVSKLKDNQNLINLSSGYIPNFAGGVKVSDIPALSDSVMRERAAGVPSSAIRINTDKRLKNSGNPNGLAVTNVIDEPRGMRDVFAANGYIPNFAPISSVTELSSDQVRRTRGKGLDAEIENQEKLLKEYNSILSQTIRSTEKYQKQIEEAAQNTSDLKSQKDDINKTRSSNLVEKKLNEKKIAKLKQEVRMGTSGGYTGNTQTRAKQKELDDLLKQNLKLKQDEVRLSQQSNKISRDILESEKKEQRAQVKLARTTEAQAKAADRKLIAERNAANLTSARNQRRESRGAAMQNLGLQAIFVGPMIASAIEEAVFKGMDRAEMTRGQRQGQAALQGLGSGISSAGIVAQILMGFAKMNPYVRIASIAFAGLAPIIMKFMGAAELTTDELIAQNEKRKQAANDELAAAEKILNARKILADPANYSQNELDAASKTLRDNFAKIKDVNLQKALLDNKTSFEEASKAVDIFRGKVSYGKLLSDAEVSGFKIKDRLNKNVNAGDVQDFAGSIAGLFTNKNADPKAIQGLIDSLERRITDDLTLKKRGLFQSLDSENNILRDAENPLLAMEENIFAKGGEAFKDVQKQLAEALYRTGEFDNSEARKKSEELLSNIFQDVRTDDYVKILKIFKKSLVSNLKLSVGLAKEAVERESQKIDREQKLSELTEIKNSIQTFVSDTLLRTSRQIQDTKFKIEIDNKIRQFQESVFKNVLPTGDFIKFTSNNKIASARKEFERKRLDFINKNISSLSKDFFGNLKDSVSGDILGRITGDFTKLFEKDPSKALEEIISFLESGGKSAEGLKSRLKDYGSDIDKIQFNLTDQQKTFLQSLKLLKEGNDQEKKNLIQREKIVAVEKTIAEIQANNAKKLAEVQDAQLIEGLGRNSKIRRNDFEILKTQARFNSRINNPDLKLFGNDEIDRVSRLEMKRDRKVFNIQQKNEQIKLREEVSKIFQNQELITAIALQTVATKDLTKTIQNTGESSLGAEKSDLEARISATKERIKANEVEKKNLEKSIEKKGEELKELKSKPEAGTDINVKGLFNTEIPLQPLPEFTIPLRQMQGASTFNQFYERETFDNPTEVRYRNQQQAIAQVRKQAIAEAQQKAIAQAQQSGPAASSDIPVLDPIVIRGNGDNISDIEKDIALQKENERKLGNAINESKAKLKILETQLTELSETQTTLSASKIENTEEIQKKINELEGKINEILDDKNLTSEQRQAKVKDFFEKSKLPDSVKIPIRRQALSLTDRAEQLRLNKQIQKLEEAEKRREDENKKERFGFGEGTKLFSEEIDLETKRFTKELGQNVPRLFRDGMVEAMQAAMDSSKDLGDSLRNIALGFLRTMQQAFLKNAANNLMQSFGFNSGGSVKGYATGGQVGGKSVPAMLTNGEYVMSREAVQRMGLEKMAAINNGTYPIEGYSTGGEVGTKARDAYKTHMDRFGTSFTDNKSSRFYAELWRSSPKASDEVRLMGAAEDEARREREQKKAERQEIFNTILSTIASVGLNYGAQKFSDFMSQGSAEKFGIFAKGSSGATTSVSAFSDYGYSVSDNMSIASPNLTSLSKMGAPQLDLGDFKGFGKYSGGQVFGFASGGQVRGPAGRDVIPAVLTEGEYVIKASSARKYGKRFLDNINQGRKGFYNGGATSDMGSSGTNNFNVNMNFDISSDGSSSKEGSNEDSSKNKEKNEGFREFSNHIKQVVQSEIQKELRVGGMLRR